MCFVFVPVLGTGPDFLYIRHELDIMGYIIARGGDGECLRPQGQEVMEES